METYDTLITTIALTLGVSWASGINLYAAMFMLGFAGHTGNMALPPDLVVLQDPMVMAAAGLMYCVEFFADKTPGVDTGWDALHTFIRIPAGAIMASGAVGEVGVPMELAAAIVGGGMAATTHATKASARMLINTSPEPASNWLASISEDVITIGGLWMALNHPVWFVILLIGFLALVAWLLPKIWHILGTVFQKVRGWFGRGTAALAAQSHETDVSHATTNRFNNRDVGADGLGSDGLDTANANSGASPQDMVTALERLVALRDSGALTVTEFNRAKQQLLQNDSNPN